MGTKPTKTLRIPEKNTIYDKYEVVDKLGEGSSGAVFKVQEKATGNLFACKY